MTDGIRHPQLRHESPAIPPVTMHANTRLPSRCRSDTLPPQGVGGVYGIPGERVHTSPHPGREDCRSHQQQQQYQHSGARYSRWRRRTTAHTQLEDLTVQQGTRTERNNPRRQRLTHADTSPPVASLTHIHGLDSLPYPVSTTQADQRGALPTSKTARILLPVGHRQDTPQR